MTDIPYVSIRGRTRGPLYPDGWFVVATADELSDGSMLPLQVVGRQLIAYRTSDGAARVASAYCPHLGAHLASHTGELKDGEIICPFHRWRFDSASGRCTAIGYSPKIPPKAQLLLYPVREINGLVFAYIHAEDADPDYEIEAEPLLTQGTWKSMPPLRWNMYTRSQEMMENIFDPGHVVELHNASEMPKYEKIEFRERSILIEQTLRVADPICPVIRIVTRYFGLSYLTQTIHGRTDITRLTAYTPAGEDVVERKTWMYIKENEHSQGNDWLAQGFYDRYQHEVGQDLAILRHKVFYEKPMLCAGDGPIIRWRRYAASCYSYPALDERAAARA